jgi:hypothetical protein
MDKSINGDKTQRPYTRRDLVVNSELRVRPIIPRALKIFAGRGRTSP